MPKSLEIVNKHIEIMENTEEYTILMGMSELEQIKQDLEILEILKEYVYINPKSTDNVQIISMKDILSIKQVDNEKANKIKQWLEENEL